MRSKAGKKLYAVRDELGEFTDIQSYQRAQSDDMRLRSKAELEERVKKAAAAKKSPKKKTTKRAKMAKTGRATKKSVKRRK